MTEVQREPVRASPPRSRRQLPAVVRGAADYRERATAHCGPRYRPRGSVDGRRAPGRATGLLYAWAISQAAGVDAQLVASAAKLAAAVHARRALLAAGYGGLIIPLASVGFLPSNLVATPQKQGLTTPAAHPTLGLDGPSIYVQR